MALVMTGLGLAPNARTDEPFELTSLNIEVSAPSNEIENVKIRTVEYHLDPSYEIW